ncbi:hypothetical protein THAOC_19428, partial [Thalassiosira oceanica]
PATSLRLADRPTKPLQQNARGDHLRCEPKCLDAKLLIGDHLSDSSLYRWELPIDASFVLSLTRAVCPTDITLYY